MLIGPNLDGRFSASGIADLVNVHWQGLRHYGELPVFALVRCRDGFVSNYLNHASHIPPEAI